MKLSPIWALALLAPLASATPTTSRFPKRESDPLGNLATVLRGIRAGASQGDPSGLLQALQNVPLLRDRPGTIAEAAAQLQAVTNGTTIPPATLFEYIANLRALNLIDSIDSLSDFANGVADGQDSTNNVNPDPTITIYPQRLNCDTRYTIDENTLRSAIYIPSTFTYGTIPPVILFPGTGNFGYETFAGNFIPLLTNSDFADPVWVNVPGRLLNDAQKNAEFAAYAINYISSITKGKNVTVLGWSQGNIDTQWAFKYWPSTTKVTSSHVAVSPDYAGTVIANFVALPGQPLPPSVLQQEYLDSSNFITTLRNCDGDSAYVPTTTIYSGFFDEIVEPQQGTGASAFLKDARGVGVTNNEVQLVCPGQPAGTFYTHEGVLYNPLSYFLLRDSMVNSGPGDIKRLQLQTVCSTYLTPGLDLGDFFVTENTVAIAGSAILTYPNPVFVEPAISAYASSCPTSTCQSSTTTTATSSASTSFTTTTSTSLTILTTIVSSTSSASSTVTISTSAASTSSYTWTTTLVTTLASSTQSSSNSATTTSAYSTSKASTTTSSLISSGWNQWEPIPTVTSSVAKPDESPSWTSWDLHSSATRSDRSQYWAGWQAISGSTLQVVSGTWTSRSATHTPTVTVASEATYAPSQVMWEGTEPTTSASETLISDVDSGSSTKIEAGGGWQTQSSMNTNTNSVQTSYPVQSAYAWSEVSVSPTLYATTYSTTSSDAWAGPSSANSVPGDKVPTGIAGTAIVAQWKGSAEKVTVQFNVVGALALTFLCLTII